MIQHKRINIVIMAVMTLALFLTGVIVVLGNHPSVTTRVEKEPEYATKLFGTDIISVDILADEDDWAQMLAQARDEQFMKVDVIVNGTTFHHVGIRPKGNSSLTQVASSDSDRYSFRLQFDEYIDGQTCFGLDSFVINNMLGDNTYMKEYISYELMHEAGVDAPYFGFASIKVNGEAWGLYLAVELYNDSYENRVFQDTSGMLYNVKSMDMGNPQGGNIPAMSNQGNGRPQRMDSFQADENSEASPSFSDMPNMANGERFNNGFGLGSRGSSGGSLEYSDDSIESYSAIFDNVVGKGKSSDFQRVIRALKALSDDEDLEQYFDVDQILRYLAAHTIVVNLDSYSSSMAQNYYLYERDGKVTILPWDIIWLGVVSKAAMHLRW